MKITPRYVINIKEFIVLLACIIVSLILIFSNKNSQVEAIKVLTLDLMGSLQGRLTFLTRNYSLEESNNFLRYQNTLLALENSQMRNALLENQRLRNLIGFQETNQFNLIAAKVIGGSFSGVMNNIVLDVGKQDSVKKNMPLVLPNGLVGKIYEVGKNYSTGQLLLDQNFRVSAKILRSGARGIVSWKGGRICNLDEIANRSDVKIGDLVMTSGYSEIFPEGIYIGRVLSASNNKRNFFMDIKVKPDVDFNTLEEVLVIMSPKTENFEVP